MNKDYQEILYKHINVLAGDKLGDSTTKISVLALAIQDLEYRIKQLEAK